MKKFKLNDEQREMEMQIMKKEDYDLNKLVAEIEKAKKKQKKKAKKRPKKKKKKN